jgi:hypothetical protein
VWSGAAAVLGVVATSVVLRRARQSEGDMEPGFYWVLGLGAMTPAWVVAFLSLLAAEAQFGDRLKLFFGMAIGVGLAGVFTTDAIVRRLHASRAAPSSLTLWLLGIAALVPAWALTLVGWPWIK